MYRDKYFFTTEIKPSLSRWQRSFRSAGGSAGLLGAPRLPAPTRFPRPCFSWGSRFPSASPQLPSSSFPALSGCWEVAHALPGVFACPSIPSCNCLVVSVWNCFQCSQAEGDPWVRDHRIQALPKVPAVPRELQIYLGASCAKQWGDKSSGGSTWDEEKEFSIPKHWEQTNCVAPSWEMEVPIVGCGMRALFGND